MLSSVLCGKCGYNLSGLAKPSRCPECGSEDWNCEPATGRWIRIARVNLALSVIPFAWLLLLHIMRVIARIELGHWPKRSVDNPKLIPIVQDLLILATAALPIMFLAIVGNVSIVMALSARMKQPHVPPRLPIAALVTSVGLWALAAVLIVWDPTGAVQWIGD